MKSLAKKIVPVSILSYLRTIILYFNRVRLTHQMKNEYLSDMHRYLKFSKTLNFDDPKKLAGEIIIQYHVIEKGLTMPDVRPGFGKDRIIRLCHDCILFIQKYGLTDQQVQHAIGVILEYEEFHNSQYIILDIEVSKAISELKNNVGSRIQKTSQIQISRTEYFKETEHCFPSFSSSRASVRHFSDENISLDKIINALEFARNTPSACNRQSWRTYVYTQKDYIIKILNTQGGNRGFGHLANKVIVISGELGVFGYTNERYQVYIDGGMYAMNLLYALHYCQIAACILNCSFDNTKEHEIRKLCKIKDSEVLIAMIACGIAPDNFKLAISPRYSYKVTNSII